LSDAERKQARPKVKVVEMAGWSKTTTRFALVQKKEESFTAPLFDC